MATSREIAANTITSINPATAAVLRSFACASAAEVQRAVLRAHAAQPAWNDVGIKRRTAIIREFQRVLHKNKSKTATLITSEAGKPYVEALLTEVMVVLDAIRFCVENAYSFTRDEHIPHGNVAMKTKRGRLCREPYGVIGIISPWNYPFSIPATDALAALVTGNTVVLKPSEFTSLVALELAAMLHQAGVPEDVFQVVVGDAGTGAALIDSDIDKLVFTGSVPTGKRIGEAAATRLLPVVLELGGKDPMLVLNDANLDVASSGAVWGAFVNAGQACLSVERCYVDRTLYGNFVDACVGKMERLRVGDGMDPDIDVGPLIHERQLRMVEDHVEDARARGARVLVGGHRLDNLGPNFYAPTLIADVTHDMRIMREETFGPVLPIMAFDTDEEAIRLANDSEFGLAASVWTKNLSRGEAIARQIRAGTVMVNDVVSCFGISEAPHGGVEASGVGRSHGRLGFEEMVRTKYIDVDRMAGMKKPWWYPYGKNFSRAMESFLDFQFARGLAKRIASSFRAAGIVRRKDLL